MKQILIRYDEDVSDEEALRYTHLAFKDSHWRTGAVVFNSGVVLSYSDRSKYPSVYIYKENRDEK